MANADYYQVLGVRPTATREEIQRAYRRRARRVHPDTHPEWKDDAAATRRMAALNEAYAVLADPSRRAAYDLQRRDGRAIRARGQASPRPAATESQPTPARRAARMVFAPSVDRQARLAVLALLLTAAGVYGANLTVNRGSLLGVLLMATGLLSGALCAMAVMPTFQGHVLLARDALTEYSSLGVFGERAYPYDQICDVHWKARRGVGAPARILIDYFERDRSGQLQTGSYQSKWLMPVDDPHTLYHLLRERATAQKYAFSRPTWWAVLVHARELAVTVVIVFGTIVAVLFWGATGSGG
ncbi:MAG TPA: J domain-containing protein [Anaerolineae bacterium]|nr:J domain-containing protein [Anaerolineae bacterium]